MDRADYVDVAVIGAGTVGLCAAAALLREGLRVALIDPRPAHSLIDSTFDGRDVALSNGILAWLDELKLTRNLSTQERCPIRGALVSDALNERTLRFGPAQGHEAIGAFIPEHRLRDDVYDAIAQHPRLVCRLGRRVTALHTRSRHVTLTLDDGESLNASLVAAADGRRSPTRALLGIKHRIQDQAFDMVCLRVAHTQPHDGWTVQCFDQAGSIARLPLTAHTTSLAMMMRLDEAARMMALEDEAFVAEITARLGGTLGEISVASTRYRVPLSGLYAEHFAAPRAVLLGDAAVGMLPITAHGLNLGLIGVRSLVAEVAHVRDQGGDIGGHAVTAHVARRAQMTAWPLYTATQEVARLFMRQDSLALKARQVMMTMAGPFEALVGLSCEQRAARQVPWLGALARLLPSRRG